MRTVLSLLAASAILASMPVSAQDESRTPRTLLEALDTSSPQATAGAFAARYAASDYFAAAFLFTFDAKTDFQAAMMSRSGVSRLFPRSPGTVGAAAVHTLDGPFMTEQTLDFSVFFDDVMYQAEVADLLPFDISPDAAIIVSNDEAGVATAEIDDAVTLYLVQTRPDHWLIDRVGLSGRDGNSRPW